MAYLRLWRKHQAEVLALAGSSETGDENKQSDDEQGHGGLNDPPIYFIYFTGFLKRVIQKLIEMREHLERIERKLDNHDDDDLYGWDGPIETLEELNRI